jgi:hypothetical protein
VQGLFSLSAIAWAGRLLVVQNHTEEATVDGESAMVIDEAQLLELIHEKSARS